LGNKEKENQALWFFLMKLGLQQWIPCENGSGKNPGDGREGKQLSL
jgi:hypothetical protein